MIVKREIHYACTMCKERVTLYEYKGLKGLYGPPHMCENMRDWLASHPNESPIDFLLELKGGTKK